jgi:flagellar biogenesis protein FliO
MLRTLFVALLLLSALAWALKRIQAGTTAH